MVEFREKKIVMYIDRGTEDENIFNLKKIRPGGLMGGAWSFLEKIKWNGILKISYY